jgi:protein gp37
MATQSKIEWTEVTWNPVTGCTKVSAGCKNCYAERMAYRLQAMGVARYQDAFSVRIHGDLLDLPQKWKQPKIVFVNSMSDLFHDDVPDDFISKVFETMAACPRHTFQVLTKRSKRLADLSKALPWSDNIWMGVSIENEKAKHRISDLRSIPAKVRFLSCEPLIGPISNMNLQGIHWVIVGGESGPKSRIMEPSWVEDIYAQCRASKVPFFFKQWGGVRKDRSGRLFHDRTYDEMPVSSVFI